MKKSIFLLAGNEAHEELSKIQNYAYLGLPAHLIFDEYVAFWKCWEQRKTPSGS